MDRDSSPEVLKQGVARSVRLVRGGAGEAGDGDRIVKLFRSRRGLPALLAGLAPLDRDRVRAAREHDVLTALYARGIRVPRPLGLAPADGGGWEVTMECIPDAVPLADLFDGRSPWPRSPNRVAVELGRLLADLHAAGVRHADLHAGNVLVGDGRPVAIDFHKARIVERPERGFARAASRNLTQLVAGSREAVEPGFRARFATAWRRALPDRLRAALPEPRALAASVERAGRLLRREVVLARRRRWTRDGTACHALSDERGFTALDVPGQRITADVAEQRFDALARLGAGLHPHPHDPDRRVLVVEGESASLRAAWYAAARLWEHRLPCGRPLAVSLSDSAWFALEVPADAQPDRALAPDALHALAAALADRGVAPTIADRAHVFVDARGDALLVGVPDLAQVEDAARRWGTQLSNLEASRG